MWAGTAVVPPWCPALSLHPSLLFPLPPLPFWYLTLHIFGSSSAGIGLPTSVVERKSRIAWLHLPLARGSWILHRLFLLLLSSCTSAHRIFCWAFHSGHILKKWCRSASSIGTTSTGQRADSSPSGCTAQKGSDQSSAGRTLRQASWNSQPPCRPASGSSAFCISSWRSLV